MPDIEPNPPRLTVERLFSEPPLTGTLPQAIQFSPDGRLVTYLTVATDDRERQDLWCFDPATGQGRELVNAARFLTAGTMTDAEKAERERLRQFSRGIVSYQWLPDASGLVIPIDGVAYLCRIDATGAGDVTAITPQGRRQTDFTVSPNGRYLSYVRDNDLYTHEFGTGAERRITSDGGELISNGIADFIAQEEMHRFAGHWWAPDESRLAFTRTDESPVAVSHRYEIDADRFDVIEQRYPYAGATNADVALNVYDMNAGTTVAVDYKRQADDYLARVDFTATRLAVQVQRRNQQHLVLRLFDPAAKTPPVDALEERSATWINLHDNFRELPDGSGFLWTSERNDHAQLFRYDYATAELTRVADTAGRVDAIATASAQHVWFTGWLETPTEQHLYRVSLDTGTVQQLTSAPGWHQCWCRDDGSAFVDLHSNLDQPPELTLNEANRRTVIHSGAIGEAHPYAPYRARHVRAELGELTAADGQTLYYRLTPPTDTCAPGPLIVYVYGGPGVHYVRNEWPPMLRQLFAQNGFGVLELDNRGSSNRTRSFEAPIYRQLGHVEVNDQLVGVAHANRLPWVDPERIGVFGHSYGGYMTCMCLCRAPDVFKAGVAVAPVSDWALYDTHYTERYMGLPADNRAGFEESQVLPHLEGLRGHLLLMHGMADDNVLFTHTTRLIKQLQTLNKPFEMMTYPGSKHALQERTVSIHRFEMILDFFRRRL